MALPGGPIFGGSVAQASEHRHDRWGRSITTASFATASFAREAAKSPSPPTGPTREYKVKAALLLNFLKYSKFPDGVFPKETSPITVLIIGKDPFGSSLRASLAKKRVGKRPIKIVHVRQTPKDLKAHLVFVSGLSRSGEARLIERLKDKPCLLVGETDGFAQRGGFIHLFLDESKVRFDINGDRTKTTRIKLKADLLRHARNIVTKDPKGPR